jgi:hypothetical protein
MQVATRSAADALQGRKSQVGLGGDSSAAMLKSFVILSARRAIYVLPAQVNIFEATALDMQSRIFFQENGAINVVAHTSVASRRHCFRIAVFKNL